MDTTLTATDPRDPAHVPTGDLSDAIREGNPTPSDFQDDAEDEMDDSDDDMEDGEGDDSDD